MNTPTPRTDEQRKIIDSIRPDGCHRVEYLLGFASILETELAAVTEQLKAAQDGWHDEITKGLSELRRAESLYTKAQERAERAEEQRDRLQKIVDEQCRVFSVCREMKLQRDRLAAVVNRWRKGKHSGEYGVALRRCVSEIDEVLQTLNQPQQ